MSRNIAAFTGVEVYPPEFISINVEDSNEVSIYVRSKPLKDGGEGSQAVIRMKHADFLALLKDATNNICSHEDTVKDGKCLWCGMVVT